MMFEEDRIQLNNLCGESFNLVTELEQIRKDFNERIDELAMKAKALYFKMDDKLDEETKPTVKENQNVEETTNVDVPD